MLYIVTALYEEALPFINHYRLKRKTDFPHFDLFTSETTLLLITRPGALRAATALSSLLTAFPPGPGDFLLSAGCAGCSLDAAAKKAFLLARITEGEGGRTRYPELLYRCPFPLAETITQSRVQLGSPNQSTVTDPQPSNNEMGNAPLPLLYDMEAAGVYEAAIPYFSCERLFFIKVVSDALTGLLELPSPMRRAHVIECMEGILPELTAWLDELNHFFCTGLTGCHAWTHLPAAPQKDCSDSPSRQPFPSPKPRENLLGMEGEKLFTDVCNALRLSAASSQQLYQLMLYLTLAGQPYLDSMKKFLATPLTTPCRTKKEGLHYLGQLTEYYLSFTVDLCLR